MAFLKHEQGLRQRRQVTDCSLLAAIGLPVNIAQRLVDLVVNGYTIVRTPYALSKWDVNGLEDVRDIAFNPVQGTRQGAIHNRHLTWLALFDVPVAVLDNQPLSICSGCLRWDSVFLIPSQECINRHYFRGGAIRRRSKNLGTSQTENLYQPVRGRVIKSIRDFPRWLNSASGTA